MNHIARTFLLLFSFLIAACDGDITTPDSSGGSNGPSDEETQVADQDGDGVGDAVDCEPDNAAVHTNRNYTHVDKDGDGRTVAESGSICSGASLPNGYENSATNAGDCDDANSEIFQYLTVYADGDGDGYGAGASSQRCSGLNPPSGYVLTATDCNDADSSLYQNLTVYADSDGDSYGAGASSQLCSGGSPASGYSLSSNDCNDSDSSKWALEDLFTDADGDSHGTGSATSTCIGSSVPSGLSRDYCDIDDSNNRLLCKSVIVTDSDVGYFAISGANVAVKVGNQVRIYTKQGSSWNQTATLNSPRSSGSSFGNVMAMDGDLLAIGEPDYGAGFVDVYKRSGTYWGKAQSIQPTNLAAYADFGSAISLKNQLLVIGAHNDYNGSFSHEGTVSMHYLYATGKTQSAYNRGFPTGAIMYGGSFGSLVATDGNAFFAYSPGKGKSFKFTLGSGWGEAVTGAVQALKGSLAAMGTAIYKKSGSSWSLVSTICSSYCSIRMEGTLGASRVSSSGLIRFYTPSSYSWNSWGSISTSTASNGIQISGSRVVYVEGSGASKKIAVVEVVL